MLGLLTSHLHANYRYWDYWDSAGNSVASAHIHTQTHAHTHQHTGTDLRARTGTMEICGLVSITGVCFSFSLRN